MLQSTLSSSSRIMQVPSCDQRLLSSPVIYREPRTGYSQDHTMITATNIQLSQRWIVKPIFHGSPPPVILNRVVQDEWLDATVLRGLKQAREIAGFVINKHENVSFHEQGPPSICATLGKWKAQQNIDQKGNFELYLDFIPKIDRPSEGGSALSTTNILYPTLRLFDYSGSANDSDVASLPAYFHPVVYATTQLDDTDRRQSWFGYYEGDDRENQRALVSAHDGMCIDVPGGVFNKEKYPELMTWCAGNESVRANSSDLFAPSSNQKWSMSPDAQSEEGGTQFFFFMTCTKGRSKGRTSQVITAEEDGRVRLKDFDASDPGQKWEIILNGATVAATAAAEDDDDALTSKAAEDVCPDFKYCSLKDKENGSFLLRNKRGQYLTCGSAHSQDSLPSTHETVLQRFQEKSQLNRPSAEKALSDRLLRENRRPEKAQHIDDQVRQSVYDIAGLNGFQIVVHPDNPCTIGFVPGGAASASASGAASSDDETQLYSDEAVWKCFHAMHQVAKAIGVTEAEESGTEASTTSKSKNEISSGEPWRSSKSRGKAASWLQELKASPSPPSPPPIKAHGGCLLRVYLSAMRPIDPSGEELRGVLLDPRVVGLMTIGMDIYRALFLFKSSEN